MKFVTESIKYLALDTLNIKELLIRMKKFIAGKFINSDKANNIKDLEGMGKAIQEFIAMVYELHQNALHINNNNMTFRSKVKSKFASQVKNTQATSIKDKDTVKLTFVSAIPPPIPAKLNKEVKKISKYFKKIKKPTATKLYAQALTFNTNPNITSKNITMNILKIKEAFLSLSNKKINIVQKIVNGTNDKPKLRLNMTTKGLSHKQVIVPMNNDLGKRFIKDSANYVTNISHALKSIKSNICTDFICADIKGVIISTNSIALNSNLQEIKKYVKNSLQINDNSIVTSRLFQSKSYLKIVRIPYYIDKSNTRISLEDIKRILKNTHIFNNIVLASKPRIIKVSPKSDMAIIWINMWDNQNDNNAKKIINRQFNVRSIIAMMRGANINPGIP